MFTVLGIFFPISSAHGHSDDSQTTFSVIEQSDEFLSARETGQDYYGEDFTILYDGNESGIIPFAVTACPYGNGICDAVKRGAAVVLNYSDVLLFRGSAWQCTKCGTAYITENDLGVPVGRWGSYATQGKLSTTTYYYTNSPRYTSAYEIPGIQRRYQ